MRERGLQHDDALEATRRDGSTAGIRSLADCSTSVLHDYGQHLLDATAQERPRLKILVSLTRLWAFDQLSARPNGVGRPPWEDLRPR